MRSILAIPILAACMASLPNASAQEGSEPSPFADADMKPTAPARCHEVRRLTEGHETGDKRMDFSVTGPLAFVQIGQALTYLGLCGAEQEPKVLCVTYQLNGMRVGDVVTMTGGYSRPDDDHIVLDPCLASPADQPEQ